MQLCSASAAPAVPHRAMGGLSSHAPSGSLTCCWTCCPQLTGILLPAGKLCIEVTKTDKVAFISEELCIGCGICVKVRLPES